MLPSGYRLFTSVCLALALIGLPAAGRSAEPFQIYVLLPLTGGSTFIGQGAKAAFEALQKYVNDSGGINGRPLEFLYRDDETKPQVAVQIVNTILAGKAPPVIMGTATVAGCRAILPLIERRVVLYCMSPGLHPDKGSYAFSSNVSTYDTATAAIRYFVGRGIKRIATITSSDANGQDADAAIDGGLDAMKAQSFVVAREHFNPTDLSVAAQVARIKAAAPQLIIAWTSGIPFGTVLHGIKDAGLDDLPVLTTNANSNRPTLRQFSDLLPRNLYFPNQESELTIDQISNPATKRAVATFFTAMNGIGVTKPDESNDANWDPGFIVISALRKLGTDVAPERLRDYIGSLRGFTGGKGPYDFVAFPQRGLSQSAVVLTRWDPSKDAWIAVSKLGGAPL